MILTYDLIWANLKHDNWKVLHQNNKYGQEYGLYYELEKLSRHDKNIPSKSIVDIVHVYIKIIQYNNILCRTQ